MAHMETNVKGICEMRAVVTRADGTVEDLGVIASNRLSWRIKNRLKEVLKWLMRLF